MQLLQPQQPVVLTVVAFLAAAGALSAACRGLLKETAEQRVQQQLGDCGWEGVLRVAGKHANALQEQPSELRTAKCAGCA